MFFSIRTKVFLTLLLAVCLVVFGMLALMRWSFEAGLVELAETRQQERIAQVRERLSQLYQHHGSWEHLKADPSLWLAILSGRGEFWGYPGWTYEPPARMPGWLRYHPEDLPHAWPPQRALQAQHQGRRHRPLELRLMLLDAQGAIIYARPELLREAQRIPIMRGTQRIGELALLPGPSISELGELRFRERQRNALLLFGLFMMMLSAALAFPLAKHLVRPVLNYQHTTRRLACGDYSQRVAAHSRDELGQLGRDINALAETLARNELARRRWIADISHELRTPLSLLRAHIEALQDGIRPLDQAALDSLQQDVERLGRLVNDLHELSLSDLGALSYRKAHIQPAVLLAEAVDALRPAFAEAGLTLALEITQTHPVSVLADAGRLAQLFNNLLHNSLHYTQRGGQLLIRLHHDKTTLSIDFQDSAPGVADNSLSRLCEPLYRVENSRNQQSGGSGLGLAICKNIVHAHEGTIQAHHSPLGGVWIQLKLPLYVST